MEIGTWKTWAIGTGLAVTAVLLRWQAFAQTPFANGWDSYFYLIQIKSWTETGRMHSPEASLIYPVMWWFCRVSGDYVSGFKWCAAVLAGVWVGMAGVSIPSLDSSPTQAPPPAEGKHPTPQGEGPGVGPASVRNSPKSSSSLALLPAALALFSPQLSYFAAQYPKNLLGLILLLAFIRSLPKAPKSSLRTWWAPVILLILNYFGHRQTFALALVFLALWWLAAFGKNLREVLFSRMTAGLATLTVLLLALAGRLSPGLFHLADLERLSGALSLQPQFAPWSFVRDFGMERLSGWWLAEIGAALLLLFWVTGKALAGGPFSAFQRAALVFCWLLLFPFLDWSLTGAAYRFFLVFVLIKPVLCLDMVAFSKKTGLLLSAVLVLGAFFSWTSYNPKKHDPDYGLFAKVTAVIEKDSVFRASNPELVIAPNALAEFFTFTTGTDALPWLPEYAMAPGRLWRIVANVQQPEVEYFSESAVRRLPGGYLLLREAQWKKALERARVENDTDFVERARGWPNPARVRPGYLLQRKGESGL